VRVFVANKPSRATREYGIDYKIAGLAPYVGGNVLGDNVKNV
jgi:hypothetical protein